MPGSVPSRFDVIVVGGGHAGCEAAAAAAGMGLQTALVTVDIAALGRMSCNPAIGGLAKGHLVREIDALGGIMGRVADRAGIQFRLLNRSKGPAVQAPRAQTDRSAYEHEMGRLLRGTSGLHLVAGLVEDLRVEAGAVAGVVTRDGREIESRSIVLTTGTFLRGRIHVGQSQQAAGRYGEPPAVALAERLERLGFRLGRLKTGTPPRLDAGSIDFRRFPIQDGDAEPTFLHTGTEGVHLEQRPCHIAYTGPQAHAIIRQGLAQSPLFSGGITAVGPRYCPSIEDKVVRFPDRERHQLFLEPEGVASDLIYVNGLSTSLPEELQATVVHAIDGLEDARIVRAGYAIEYDYVDPTELDGTLMTRRLPGLFLAGQIDGTTGYEEAAALGLIAGVNAALRVRREPPLRLRRHEAYIGVLVDDLVTRGTREPYRMFTSRAEHRLRLGIDSAPFRLARHGRRVGLVSAEQVRAVARQKKHISFIINKLHRFRLDPERPPAGLDRGACRREREKGTSLLGLLRRPGVSADSILDHLAARDDAGPELRQVAAGMDRSTRRSLEGRVKYAGYVKRQLHEARRLVRDERRAIPPDLDYQMIGGLSAEVIEKLRRVQPENLGQAGRISGITPAALVALRVALRRGETAPGRGIDRTPR